MSDLTVVTITPTEANDPVVVPSGVVKSSQPTIHVLVGAPFGDNEFDIGKSVRWLTWFSASTFILDVNLGDQRYWVINWTESFPKSKHWVTGINYFVDPAGFRKEQWKQAQRQINIADGDWVLWVDGSEGFSVDNRDPLPDDYTIAPFTSFIWRAISMAEANGLTTVDLPFFVFLRSDEVQNATYPTAATPPNSVVPTVSQTVSTPYYIDTTQTLSRLIQASALRNALFDWSSIDQLVFQTPLDFQIQLISYAYAHWQPLDIPPGETTVPPITEQSDLGWQMRRQISKVRPIPGLGTTTWDDGTSDPVGEPGPWVADTIAPTNPDLDITTDVSTPSAPSAALQPVTTPLYDQVIRLNLRDGLWYVAGVSGNIPVYWDSDTDTWVTDYDPEEWPDQGVASGPPPVLDIVPPPQLSDLAPTTAQTGTDVVFHLAGTSFTADAVAIFDGDPVPTTVINPSVLQVTTNITWPAGVIDVFINDTTGISNSLPLTIT